MPRRSQAQRHAISRRQSAEQLARPAVGAPGLSASWAQRNQPSILAGDFRLTERARLRHPAVRWWWGQRLIDGPNGAWCYLCELMIVTWQRSYPMTETARTAILEHRDRVHSQAAPDPGTNAQPAQGGAVHEQENRPHE